MNLWTKATGSPLLRRGGVFLGTSFLSQGILFSTWLVLPWKLSAEVIGQFALLSFVVELLTRVAAMGTDSALLRFYVDPNRREQVLAAVFGWVGIGSLVALALTLLTWNLIPSLLESLGGVYQRHALLVLLAAIVGVLGNTALAHYVASQDARSFGWLSTLRSVLTAAGFLGTAWGGFGLAGLLLSQTAAAAVVVACFGFMRRGAPLHRLRPERPMLRELFVYGSPMLAYGLFSLVSDYSSRLLLGDRVALATVGVFQFYYQIATQLNGAWSSVNRAWTPHVFKRLAERPADAYADITRFNAWGTIGVAACLAAGLLLKPTGLWSLVIPPAYLDQVSLLFVLLLGPLFCCIYTGIYPAFYFTKNTLKISVVQCIVSALTILMNLYATLRFAAEGAAVSWAFGIFLTPWIYALCFPGLRSPLRASLWILLGWGIAAAATTWALLVWRSYPGAALALVAGAAGATLAARRVRAGHPAS